MCIQIEYPHEKATALFEIGGSVTLAEFLGEKLILPDNESDEESTNGDQEDEQTVVMQSADGLSDTEFGDDGEEVYYDEKLFDKLVEYLPAEDADDEREDDDDDYDSDSEDDEPWVVKQTENPPDRRRLNSIFRAALDFTDQNASEYEFFSDTEEDQPSTGPLEDQSTNFQSGKGFSTVLGKRKRDDSEDYDTENSEAKRWNGPRDKVYWSQVFGLMEEMTARKEAAEATGRPYLTSSRISVRIVKDGEM